ncbi:hypothetical protein H2201_006187 [Coniosporium apollinis]|uniref:Protein kinase domain-containing protein n=1 Tax=Coniosporium apollinis TaxID=61459 RepID=A0ABQ9NPG7_9PEZI|nr:hypothetical protein H2201_006187 [Coniosporium apollinis]
MANLPRETLNGAVDNALLTWFPHLGSTPVNLKERVPFKESDLRGISDVLRRTGRDAWSRIPRIYAVLRIINQLQAIEVFLSLGVSDVWFPFSPNTLPDALRSAEKSDFLNAQRLVLTKALSLEQEDGKHRHFSDPTELPFTKIAELGRGGFGFVDHVVSTISSREYARKRILRGKTFHNDQKVLKDFENELSNLKRLSHYHIVTLVGSYTDRRSVCLLMAPVADCNLKQYLDAGLRKERRSLLRTFFGCLSSAVRYLHENKVRHKDIKPQNILVKGGDHVYLTDFGLSLNWSEADGSTTTAETTKTPRYSAPELAANLPRNTASDIWSLGCVFLEIWTVINGCTVADLTAHLESTGSRSTRYHLNLEGVNSWCSLNVIRLSTGGVDAPLTWIENMLVETPSRRWTANFLFAQIQECSSGFSSHSAYCGSCCLEGLESPTSVHSPTTTEKTFNHVLDDATILWDDSELASLPISFVLAARNRITAARAVIETSSNHPRRPIFLYGDSMFPAVIYSVSKTASNKSYPGVSALYQSLEDVAMSMTSAILQGYRRYYIDADVVDKVGPTVYAGDENDSVKGMVLFGLGPLEKPNESRFQAEAWQIKPVEIELSDGTTRTVEASVKVYNLERSSLRALNRKWSPVEILGNDRYKQIVGRVAAEERDLEVQYYVANGRYV